MPGADGPPVSAGYDFISPLWCVNDFQFMWINIFRSVVSLLNVAKQKLLQKKAKIYVIITCGDECAVHVRPTGSSRKGGPWWNQRKSGEAISYCIFYIYLHKWIVICASTICILFVFVNFSLSVISNDISLHYKEIIYETVSLCHLSRIYRHAHVPTNSSVFIFWCLFSMFIYC